MSWLRGLLLIVAFSVVWGLLAGLNAVVFRVAIDLPPGRYLTVLTVVVALLELLAFSSLWTHFARTPTGIRSPADMRCILDAVRLGTQQGGGTFALLAFHARGEEQPASLAALVRVLRKQLRTADVLGLLTPDVLAAILPGTDLDGARRVYRAVCAALPSEITVPRCRVYIYPVHPARPDEDEVTAPEAGALFSEAEALFPEVGFPSARWAH